MAFPAIPPDANGVPIGAVYVPGVGFIAIKGATNTNTDGSSNASTAVALALDAAIATSGTLQNAQTGNTVGTALNVLGYTVVIFTVTMSGFTGTVTFKGSEDTTNYDPLLVTQQGTTTTMTSVTGSTTTNVHLYAAFCAGLQSVEAVTSSVSAGNVTVTAHAVPMGNIPSAGGTGGGGGAVTVADGADVAQGATTDTAVVGDTAGTLSAKMRGLTRILNDIWDSTNHLFHSNVKQVGGNAVSTAATGVQKVGIVGNGGAAVDSTIGAGTAPANQVVAGSIYNSSAPAPTSGQAMAQQADQAGNLRIVPGIALAALSAWNNGTALNATQTIFTNSGVPAVLVQLTQTTTLTAGAITFEVNYDGTNWGTIPAGCVLDPTSATFAQISLPYTVQANTNKAILLNMNGAQGLRIKLSTQITGTGSVTPNYALLPESPADTVIALSPTAANFQMTVGAALPTGSNVIGAVTQSGTWTMQPGNTANTTPWLFAGKDASGASSTTNPNQVGGLAATALPTAVSNAQVVEALFDKFGRQVVVLDTVRDLKNNIPGLTLTSTAETTLIAAVASTFNDITGIICENTSATAVRVDFRDSATGTIQFSLYLPAGDVRGFSNMFYKQGAVNTAWTAQLSAAVTDVRIYGTYVANK